jgi:Tfp pilus assembly protein PilV
MTTRHIRASIGARRGISLLEVLISIGILAVGLTAVLSLIPAGRSYMQKAAIDDRAAILIPNAYALVQNKGLFRENALSWQISDGPASNDGEKSPYYRSTTKGNWSATGQIQANHWTVSSIDSEVIEAWWPRSTPPDLKGTAASGSSTVYIATTPMTVEFTGTTAPNGSWTISLKDQDSKFPAPDLEITTSGSGVGEPKNQPYVDYTFSGKAEVSGSMRSTGVTPPTYRQMGRLRQTDLRRGRARVTYTLGDDPRQNETTDQAALVNVKPIRATQVAGRNSITRSSQATVTGHLWRTQIGTREGPYEQRGSFPNLFPAVGTWGDPSYSSCDMITNVGDTWVDGSGAPKAGPDSSPADEDWYQFPVESDVVVELAWTDPGNVLDQDPVSRVCCPLYLGSSANPIIPFEKGPGRAWYWIPSQGTAFTQLRLRQVNAADDSQITAGLQNTFGPSGTPNGSRSNPSYSLTATVFRSERAIAFDPLMAARLDKIIDLGGGAEPRLKRERFADFQQTLNGQPRAFVIPRLSLQSLATIPVDIALAAAERVFRDEDALAVDPPTNDEKAPEARFDTYNGTPLRRQAAGRMSWMMLIQPQDPGPVAMNWVAGKMFDVSFVIFQDRKLPALDVNASLEGEYAFAGSWSDTTGMLSVTVPFDVNNDGTRDLVADDLRAIFRTGSWLLVAPARASTSPAFSNQQRLDWVRIRTAELVNEQQSTTVRILLESEPNDDVLMRGTLPPSTQDFPVAVLAYEGVVAVVNKTLQLEPGQ